MARRKELTDEDVEKLTGEEGTLYSDSLPEYLFIRFGRRTKSYTVVTKDPSGKQKWRTIGQTNRVLIKDALEKGRHIVEQIRAGDLAKEGTLTLEDVVESYRLAVGRHQHRWHKKHYRHKKWLLPEFGKRPFLNINRNEVNVLLNKIAARSTRMADQVRTDLSVLEKHFLGMGQVPNGYHTRFRGDEVPKRGKANPRARVLDNDELRLIWAAAGKAGRFGVILKLCLYTGQRLTKILSMQWSHLDLDNGQWRIPHLAGEKGVPKVLTLPPAVIALIKTQMRMTDYVFYGIRGTKHMVGLSEMKEAFKAQLPTMERWTPHDLRRTCRTLLSKIKVDFFVAEAVLGHVLGGVAGIYNRDDRVDEMAEALVKLQDHIATIVGENVVPLATKKPKAKRPAKQTKEAVTA
jgi:integrase